MLIEINLLKEKHGILARYEKQGDKGEGIHQRRTISILIITVLLAVLVGLNYGDKLFSVASVPLSKSLDYAMELIPRIMGKAMAPEEETPLPPVVDIEEGIGDLFEEAEKTEPPPLREEGKADLQAEKQRGEKQGDILSLIAGEKTKPSVALQKQAMPAERKVPAENVQEASSPQVAEPETEQKKSVSSEQPAVIAKKKVSAPASVLPKKAETSSAVPAGTYINAGAYLMTTNVKKLKRLGRKHHFTVYTEVIHRNLKNYSFSLGNVSDEKAVERIRKDLKKHHIKIVVTKTAPGKTEVQTLPTPLAFLADRQKKLLTSSGYLPKLRTFKQDTPLTKILIGPLEKSRIKAIRSLLKKSGFPTSLTER